MFPIQRNWLKVEQSDKLIRRRLSSECSKSSVSTRSLISQMNDILLPSALLPLNTMVSLEQAANFELDCCKAHSHAKKKNIRNNQLWLVWIPSTGWHPNAEPNAFWAQWTVLGWLGSASAKRTRCSGALLALMCMVVAGTLCEWYHITTTAIVL